MFPELSHTKPDIFSVLKKLALVCFKVTKSFPPEEKFGIISQIRKAALSVHLNICEGSSRRSIVDTAFDFSVVPGFLSKKELEETGQLIIRCFPLLSKIISR
jgi:four helix bundle protein